MQTLHGIPMRAQTFAQYVAVAFRGLQNGGLCDAQMQIERIGAIRRRVETESDGATVGELRVFFDGRDPEVRGEPLPLPRRERRILEYLVGNQGRRVTKSQIFNSIYGLFDENVVEDVVESHISKLRKKLRHRLGFDPIDSKRYLGYCLAAC